MTCVCRPLYCSVPSILAFPSPHEKCYDYSNLFFFNLSLPLLPIPLTHFYSHLLLTSKDMIILREAPDRAGWGRVKHRENLGSILKITAKKHHPDIVTFKFGHHDNGGTPVLTHQIRMRLPNTRKATEAIKDTVEKANKS